MVLSVTFSDLGTLTLAEVLAGSRRLTRNQSQLSLTASLFNNITVKVTASRRESLGGDIGRRCPSTSQGAREEDKLVPHYPPPGDSPVRVCLAILSLDQAK